MQKVCITHREHHRPHPEGYRKRRTSRGKAGPGLVNRGMLLSVVTRELTPLRRRGVFVTIPAPRGLRGDHWAPLMAAILSTPF